MRTLFPVLLLTASLATAFLPGAAAERLDTYDLVGEDAAGDATHYWVTGVADPSALFTPDRLDILALEMGLDGESLHVKLNIGTTPTGTSGYMYRVLFDVAGTTYFTCWNTQWVGGQHEEENVLGCSRFGDGTQVGPDLKADGVDVDTVDDVSFVRWEVALDSIGEPTLGDTVANVMAETWVRGVSSCCAGSTTSSQYLWNRGDVGPDEGAWEYVLGGSAGDDESPLTLSLDRENQTTGPGSWLVYEVNATYGGNETANLTFTATGPDGWDATVVAAENATLDGSNNTTLTEVHVGVPEDADNGTYSVTVTSAVDGNVSTSLNITIVVDASLKAIDERPHIMGAPFDLDDDATGNETTGNETAGPAEEDAGIPGPGALFAAAAFAAAAAFFRRRRETL